MHFPRVLSAVASALALTVGAAGDSGKERRPR